MKIVDMTMETAVLLQPILTIVETIVTALTQITIQKLLLYLQLL